jgi:hypothetical protein
VAGAVGEAGEIYVEGAVAGVGAGALVIASTVGVARTTQGISSYFAMSKVGVGTSV